MTDWGPEAGRRAPWHSTSSAMWELSQVWDSPSCVLTICFPSTGLPINNPSYFPPILCVCASYWCPGQCGYGSAKPPGDCLAAQSLVPGPAAVFLGASKNAEPQGSPANPPGLLHFNTSWPPELEGHCVASHHACNQCLHFEFLRDPFPGMSESSSPFCVAWMRITARGRRVCTHGWGGGVSNCFLQVA